MFKFKDYLIIKKCDLKTLFNLISDLKQDIKDLKQDNNKLKEHIINYKCECQHDLLKIGSSGNDTNNNINVGHDAPDKENNNIIQDTIIKDFNLSLINDKGKINKRYYFKSLYLFTTKPKYYNLLNLKFNELMKQNNNDALKVKPLLKSYLLELQSKDI